MFGIIATAAIVAIICVTVLIAQDKEHKHLEKVNNYRSNSNVEHRNDLMFLNLQKKIDDFKESYYEDFKGLNQRIENLEKLDGEYKKKVDALCAKAGFKL